MHIMPFKGKNHSGTYALNLLWKKDKVYIMDNHLAASWCWLQKINNESQYNLLHIDRHYDLLDSQTDLWIKELKKHNFELQSLTIVDLLALKYSLHSVNNEKLQIFRWDNYIPIFNKLFPNLLAVNKFATHKDGNLRIKDFIIHEIESWDLQENLSYWINNNENENKWIVNIDIDYFFTNFGCTFYQIFTDDFVIRIADEINRAICKIEVLTIALSPEMCGGWDNAERVAGLFTARLNIKIEDVIQMQT